MKLTACLVLAALLLAGPASAATIWDVDYFLRGDISQESRFFDDGAYAFLLTPTGTTVFIAQDTNWVFLGLYGAAPLPSDMPAIVFPVGTDAASAVSVTAPELAAVPEPSTLLLLVVGLGVLGVALLQPAGLKGFR